MGPRGMRMESGEGSTLRNLTCTVHLIRMIKSIGLSWAIHIVRLDEGRNTFKILTCKSTRKRPPGRPRHSWEHIVKMDLKEIGANARNWVDSVQDRDYWRTL